MNVYKIGGKNIGINYGDGFASSILKRELSLYPLVNYEPHIVINFNSKLCEEVIVVNPSIHEEFKKGFRCKFKRWNVSFIPKRNILEVYFEFNDNQGRSWLKKLLGKQYTHPFEAIGQIFHEIILIPAFFFYSEELSLIHASALEYDSNKAMIIAGTGGVGKTLIELELIIKKGYKFLSDDMVFVSKDGQIWPNYAYPKIYGYNILGDNLMRNKILKNRSFLDRLQWHAKMWYSPSEVRRRVNPNNFFVGKVGNKSKIKKLYFLSKGNYNEFSVEPLSLENLIKLNLEIMNTEYFIFIKHLIWHKVNSLLLNKNALIDRNKVFENWSKVLFQALSECEVSFLKIPLHYKITEVKDKILSIF
jgi:hypothetical protein